MAYLTYLAGKPICWQVWPRGWNGRVPGETKKKKKHMPGQSETYTKAFLKQVSAWQLFNYSGPQGPTVLNLEMKTFICAL